MSTQVAAVVPAYNEELTIAAVVAALKASPLLDEVIVVSDASTDRTDVRAAEAHARVVHLPQRSGKGAAMLRGVAATDAPIILFVDADLRGLTVDHVERLLAPVLGGARAMNVGLRDRGAVINRLSHWLPLISGERAMRREVIERVPPRFISGYMVESALNYWCRTRRLSYGSILLKGLSIRRKYEKVGWRIGGMQYLKMTKQIIRGMISIRWAWFRGKF